MGTLVTVHVYDVTNSSSDTANNIIIGLNKMFKDTMSLGGVFHCGVEVNMEEWSFGYCEHGTGVYSCKPKTNTMYTFRESIPVGVTSISPYRIRQIIATMQLEWPGTSYDLLSRNCNHFSGAFVEALGCGPMPSAPTHPPPPPSLHLREELDLVGSQSRRLQPPVLVR